MIEASEHRPTVAIIDLNAIQHNVSEMLSVMKPEQALYAVVKANAYGHGAAPVAKAALQAGATGLCVATVDEGIELRKAGILEVPILVLGLTDPRGIAEILLYNLTVTVATSYFFKLAQAQLEATNEVTLLTKQPLLFHLALDTGMGRIGLTTKEEVSQFAQDMAAYTWATWDGVFTHFSTAGGGDEAYIEYQWARWIELTSVVPEEVTCRHYANTAMGMWFQHEPASSIERLGISMYGFDPKDLTHSQPLSLQPAMSLISEIAYVKQVPKGTRISYGASYIAQEDEWIATIPIGYADGWFRRYHSVDVLVGGQRCPVCAPINMDQMMIRLPQYYPVGTTVTLIGQDGALNNRVVEMAQKLDTISYEIVCGIGERVPRVYLKDDTTTDTV